MQQTASNPYRETTKVRWSPLRGALILCVILTLTVLTAGCGQTARPNTSSPAAREDSMREIAAEFARSGDLAQAQARLDELNFANPGQLLVTLGRDDLGAGRPVDEVAAGRVGTGHGRQQPQAGGVLCATAAPTATPSPVPPTDTPAPATPMPGAAVATAHRDGHCTGSHRGAAHRCPDRSAANPRRGEHQCQRAQRPGRAYPVIGSLRTGQEVEVNARSNGDWWRIAERTGPGVGSGTTVRLQGQIEWLRSPTTSRRRRPPIHRAHAAAAEQPPAAPPPTNPPPAASGPDFRVIEKRLWNVSENGGCHDGPSVHCGDKRELHVIVVDAAETAQRCDCKG